MSSFERTRVYLSGPMEYQRDTCMEWRDAIKSQLLSIGFSKENIIDPVARQPKEEFQLLQQYRDTQNWDALNKISSNIVKQDLRYVDVSDFLIVHLFPNVLTCGTWDELFMACLQRKPTFVVLENWEVNAPSWLIGRVGTDQMYHNIDEVINKLCDIRQGGARPDGWRDIYE